MPKDGEISNVKKMEVTKEVMQTQQMFTNKPKQMEI